MAIPVPLSATNVRVYSGVRFTRDYANVRLFSNETERTNYFSSKTLIHNKSQANFAKHDYYSGVFLISKNIELLMTATYMVFDNGGRTYYCFIDNVEYENAGTTKLFFTLDVIQTYLFNFTFNQSLVERIHTQRFTAGTPVINTIPESLNYGDAYDISSITKVSPYSNDLQFLVIVCKQPFHGERIENGVIATNIGVPQPLSYYIHPVYTGGDSPVVKIGGVTKTISSLDDVLKAMYNSVDSVENVVSMYFTDVTGLNAEQTDGGTVINFVGYQVEQVSFAVNSFLGFTLYVKNASQFQKQVVYTGNKYTGLPTHTESKLYMYPYTVYELTDFKGNTLEIRPEYISDSNLTFYVWGSLGTHPKVSLNVANYNASGATALNTFTGYYHSLISQPSSQIPVISDYLSAFLQGNSNAIEAKKTAILTNGIMGATTSIGAGAVMRNPYALLDTANTVKNAMLEFNNLHAQMKDISNIPPNLNLQGDNANFDFGHNITGFYLIKKTIKEEYRSILTDYFKRYGYKVNKPMIPTLKTRTHFNYIKTVESNIIGDNIPRTILEEIKNIFERGVTLWHVDDMLNYNVTNNEI